MLLDSSKIQVAQSFTHAKQYFKYTMFMVSNSEKMVDTEMKKACTTTALLKKLRKHILNTTKASTVYVYDQQDFKSMAKDTAYLWDAGCARVLAPVLVLTLLVHVNTT